jgi:predicted Zn-dependent peptidase
MNKIYVHKEGKATTAIMAVPIGSYYEPQSLKGISHYLEHCVFKGTKTKNYTEINRYIEQYGGTINAMTSEEWTLYYAQVANKYKDKAIEWVTDLTTNATFPAKEIIKEKDVVIQELKMYEDDVDDKLNNLFDHYFYKQQSGFHLPIIGTLESLKNIGRKELMDWYALYQDRKTLIVVGDVEDGIKYDSKPSAFVRTAICDYRHCTLGDSVFVEDKVQQAHMCIGNDILPQGFDKTDSLYLLEILSLVYGGLSGRMFEEMREKNNLTYRTYFTARINSGGTIKWQVVSGLAQKNISKARKIIEKLLSKPVDKKELKQTIQKVLGDYALAYDSSSKIAQEIWGQERLGVSWKEYFNNYEQKIMTVADRLNEFIKVLDFKNNLTVGIVPKK